MYCPMMHLESGQKGAWLVNCHGLFVLALTQWFICWCGSNCKTMGCSMHTVTSDLMAACLIFLFLVCCMLYAPCQDEFVHCGKVPKGDVIAWSGFGAGLSFVDCAAAPQIAMTAFHGYMHSIVMLRCFTRKMMAASGALLNKTTINCWLYL